MALIQTDITLASASTTVITLTSPLATGGRSVVLAQFYCATQTSIGSVADSRGNTYAEHVQRTGTAYRENYSIAIFSAPITTALQTGDTITVTWADPAYTSRQLIVYEMPGVGDIDQATSGGNAYSSTISLPASTTAAQTTLVGLLEMYSPRTYGSSAWTAALVIDDESSHIYLLSTTVTSAGEQNPGGAPDTATSYQGAWIAAVTAATGQFARPSSDVADGNWLNEADSGTNLYASIDEETASDVDYIKSGASPANDTCTVGLGALSTPVSGTTTMRIRAKFL